MFAVLGACASELPPLEQDQGSFTFAVFGDGPYYQREGRRFDRLLTDVNAAGVSFFVHVGDILWYPCSDDTFVAMRNKLATLEMPVFYTPGDNEWTDCHERVTGRMDPLERLATLREIFFADRSWSKVGRLGTEFQSTDTLWTTYAENARWKFGDVLFATVHIVGSNNGLEGFPGRTDANDRETAGREQAALAWIDLTFAAARTQNARAVVIATHADFDFAGQWDTQGAFDRLERALVAAARAWEKPVLFIHGDSHEFIVDHPFTDRTGETVANVMRLQTVGSPTIGWVRVVVDTVGPELFSVHLRTMPGFLR